MEPPNILHPKQIQTNGFTFQIVSYFPLTDDQASKIAMTFYRARRLKKSDRKKILTVITHIDRDSLGLL